MHSRDAKKPGRKRWRVFVLFAAAGLLLLYSVAGFWIVPRVLTAKLPELIAAQLPVTAAVGEIHLNPFLLTVTASDVTVKGDDGDHLVGLKQLYANLQVSSLFRWAVVLKEVRLTEPDALVQVLPDGRMNVLTLLDSLEDSATADSDKPVQLPTIEVKEFALEGGKLVFRDLSSKTAFEAALSPIQLRVHDFTTRIDAESRFEFSAVTDRGEKIGGEGHVMVQPLAARGALNATGVDVRRLWQAVQGLVNFEITDGRVDLAGSFAARGSSDGLALRLSDGRVELKRFRLAEKGGSVPLISMPSLSIAGAGFDLKKRHVGVEFVQTDDARIQTWVSADGSAQLLTVLLPDSAPPGEATPASGPQTSPAFTIEDWSFQVDSLAVNNSSIELQDRSLSPPVPLAFGPINLSVKNLSNQPNANASIALDVRDEFGGQFDISGQAGINPVMADLTVRVRKAAVEKVEPYVRAFADMDVVNGTADAEGQINFAGSSAGPRLQYRGSMRVNNLEIFIPDDQRDLMKFTALAVNGVQIDLEPNNVQISEIAIDGLQGNLIIEPDGSLNVNRVVATVKKESTEIAESLPGRLVRAIKENIRGPVPLHIDALRVTRASASFEDRSLKPEFAMTLGDVQGDMTDISTVGSDPVKVEIGGKINASAPLRISGTAVPFGEKTDMDMKVSLKHFRLRSISPYSGKHVGYTIQKGQLSLLLEYRLSEDIIDGKNEIFLRQLTLGERTDSPNAIALPLDLAVALLKDADGNIQINVPIRGDINDPKFSVGNVFADTLIKFVTGIVSSPFKVMEGLAGAVSAEGLDRVRFAPGSSAIEDDQVEKLEVIIEGLQERPSLRVEIRGRAYSSLDAKALVPQGPETTSAEKPAADEQQLRELARQRAKSVWEALVIAGDIEPERVTILPEEVRGKSADGQITSTLSLSAE
ncbi:MAG: hypothetical protein AMJ54_07485 [Deltaproteobacteria bacterium SG8_13]|nr:MAG: hypothetical protein AMJ54_07485 [Deltaproteobacteria bacterium SG8_13]